eukprot:CAMPEP_0177431042 /NCGR_PEP_ID=MMETSP0368-20130122/75969_1 /TAXON_ID=447022 ORGANISM="Scrippsiella hangoei-like, Strain SHHI-4" /NCGR_SAMPLE_ID=MMETSP0368 /ASSEMBLY_ACC=CAM_ASM_000363 /LENGTH=121 /DNA_ID=CAMNT_0018901657 /DNA_START=360 /DNA_END=725 /DNA_ORIENTATION=+
MKEQHTDKRSDLIIVPLEAPVAISIRLAEASLASLAELAVLLLIPCKGITKLATGLAQVGVRLFDRDGFHCSRRHKRGHEFVVDRDELVQMRRWGLKHPTGCVAAAEEIRCGVGSACSYRD